MKKFCIICMLCCLFSRTAYAKSVYYDSYIDSISGRVVEYFDLDGDNVERFYFTQSYWLKNSDAFVVSDIPERKLYKYDIKNRTAEALHGDNIKCNDAGISNNNIMYMRPIDDSKLYSIDLDAEATTEEIYAQVNADGTGFEGDLKLKRWYDLSKWDNSSSYDRMIVFSGESGRSAFLGKQYSYNEEFYNPQIGEYQRWRNSWHFEIPDSFLYGRNYDTVEIEIEYYSTGNSALSLFVHSDATKYTTNVTKSEQWTTQTFVISKDDGKNATFDNGWYDNKKTYEYSDFRFMFENCQAYVHKVTVRKYDRYNIKCLGDRPSGYLVQTTNDGKFLTLTGENKGFTWALYDVENGTWTQDLFEDFIGPENRTAHAMINPVYSNIIMFAHEGVVKDGVDYDLDRMWLYDMETDSYKNLYKQRTNIENVSTGEKVGHENWTADGESIVAVKYKEPKNIGRNGIIRINKYGGECEYLNDDYDYWHCHPSPDGRWIVADTKLVDSKTKIVLIDSKTGKSYVVANPKAGWQDPWQPHPQFSRDGKKVTFSMIHRKKNGSDVLGVGIVDVSSLVNDGQYADDLYAKTNEKKGFRVSPLEINFSGESLNEVTTYIENLDGKEKKLSLYTAVYDNDGKLISLDKSDSNSSSDKTLVGNFNWTNESRVLKCFLWSDEENSPAMTSPNPVEKLRAAKTGMNYVVLAWQPSNNLIDSSYEIYRDGVKIGETSDLVYRDTNLERGTEYLYEVKPIYNDSAYIAEDNSCVTVIPTYSSGKWSMTSNINNVSGPKASVKVKTSSTTPFSEPSSTYQYAKWNTKERIGIGWPIGGRVVENDLRYLSSTTGQWMRFNVDDSYQCASHMNMAWIDITYKDIGTSEIYLEYNTSDPTATSSTKSHKRSEEVIKCNNSEEIITKRISLIDVDFSGYDGYDFRIGTNGEAYLKEVRVLGY